MKSTKWIAIIAMAGFGLFAGNVLAQGNNNDDSDAPPKMSDYNESEVTDSYNDKVTIDNGQNTSSDANSGGGFSAGAERKERLRIYSGKHDGNNVIYDPR